jgi:putative ABC transport system substrate-binding protein
VRRRDFVGLLGGVAVAFPCPAVRGQGAKRVRRIGVLEIRPASSNAEYFGVFLSSMRELGYVERRDFTIEYRHGDGHPERFPALAAELAQLKVDLILTRGTPATLAAKAATGEIPIVMFALGEPLLVVASLSRPGGNVTGLSTFANDLAAKRVELMKELVPKLARIAFLHNMGNPVAPPAWEETRAAALSIAIEPQLLDVRAFGDLKPAFAATEREGADALIVGLDAVTEANRTVIAELAASRRLPTIYPAKEFVEAGGLIAYASNVVDLYRRAAAYVDRILKGAKPGDLPVEQPIKFELTINLKTARASGVSIPPSLLARADEVIE